MEIITLIKVEVICRDIIKPSSPTPHHLRHFNLSLFDQLAPPIHVPIILFYQNQDVLDHQQYYSCTTTINNTLKKSLSDTLTRFYPLAGRINYDSGNSIDCNDDGVDYVVANVNCEVTEVINNPDIDVLKPFFPCEPYSFGTPASKSQPILSIQVNFFECGGMAIGLCISHKIADASSLTTFIKGWASTAARGTSTASSDQVPVVPCFELASLFPPIDLSGFMPNTWVSKEKIVTKRFVFDASKIAALKSKASRWSSVENPTRVEAVTAFILMRLVDMGREKAKARARARAGDEQATTVNQCSNYAASHAVNLRGRMVPALERNSFGNMTITCIAEWTVVDDDHHKDISGHDDDEHGGGRMNNIDLVGHLRDAVKKIDDDFVRRLEYDYFDFVITNTIKFSQEDLVKLSFSSWCRFPYYEADFGWGKPIWVSTSTMPFKDVVVFMDTRSGDGIEALVNMLEEDMEQFERDLEIQALAAACWIGNCSSMEK